MEENSNKSADQFEIIVVGAGISGALAAVRLSTLINSSPGSTASYLESKKILVLEKEEQVGGRLNLFSSQNLGFSSGKVTSDLLEFFQNSTSILEEMPEKTKLPLTLFSTTQKNRPLDQQSLFTREVLQKILGKSALGQTFEDLLFEEKDHGSENFLKWQKSIKSNHTLQKTLNRLIANLGILDINATGFQALKERLEFSENQNFSLDWQKTLSQVFEKYSRTITLSLNSPVITCTRNDNYWEIETPKGTFKTKNLVVAQSPWDASTWLDLQYFPKDVLNLYHSHQPLSTLVLQQKLEEPLLESSMGVILDDELIIQAQGHVISFATILEYETSLQALSVVKAIKKLRRSAIKYQKIFPQFLKKEDQIRLIPISFSLKAETKDKKPPHIQKPFTKDQGIFFVGDSYASTFNPELNVIQSILACIENMEVSS